MTEPRPRVIVLQHIAPEGPGTLGTALVEAGVVLDTVRIFAGDPVPAAIGEARGLVVMGGPMGVYEQDRYPHLGDEKRLIQDALARERPVLGVCLGSQLLASALGARVQFSGRQEIGWHPIDLTAAATADPLFSKAPPTFVPFHWHGDVFDLPAGAVTLASSALTDIQVFRFGERAYGVLFHMEVDEAVVRGMVGTFEEQARGAGVSPEALLEALPRHLPAIQAVARPIFDRWVAGVRQV